MGSDGERGMSPGERPGSTSTLAPVAMALGIAGLAVSLIPFYGIPLGLPLCVVALVLGIVARRRDPASRGQATAGVVTGGLGLVALLAWAGVLAFQWIGFGAASSSTAVTSTVTDPVQVESSDSREQDEDAGDDGIEVTPGHGDRGGLVAGLQGSATVELDTETWRLDLDECAVTDGHSTGGVLVRGQGEDGRLLVVNDSGLVVDLEVDGDSWLLTGSASGVSGSGRETLLDRHEVRIDGRMRDAHGDAIVAVRLEVICS